MQVMTLLTHYMFLTSSNRLEATQFQNGLAHKLSENGLQMRERLSQKKVKIFFLGRKFYKCELGRYNDMSAN